MLFPTSTHKNKSTFIPRHPQPLRFPSLVKTEALIVNKENAPFKNIKHDFEGMVFNFKPRKAKRSKVIQDKIMASILKNRIDAWENISSPALDF